MQLTYICSYTTVYTWDMWQPLTRELLIFLFDLFLIFGDDQESAAGKASGVAIQGLAA